MLVLLTQLFVPAKGKLGEIGETSIGANPHNHDTCCLRHQSAWPYNDNNNNDNDDDDNTNDNDNNNKLY